MTHCNHPNDLGLEAESAYAFSPELCQRQKAQAEPDGGRLEACPTFMGIMRAKIGTVIILLLSAAPAWCQADTSLAAHGSAYYLLKALLSLLIVIVLILLTYYALKKLSWPAPGALTEGPLELLQVLPVEPGRRIYLIGLKGRAYVIAWSQESVALIGELERSEVDEQLPEG